MEGSTGKQEQEAAEGLEQQPTPKKLLQEHHDDEVYNEDLLQGVPGAREGTQYWLFNGL